MPTLPSAVTGLGADLPKIGLAETIYTAGGIIRALPFDAGNGRLAHTYNEEATNPLVGSIEINGDVPQGLMTVTPKTVNYKWFGGDVPLDPRLAPMGQPVQNFFAIAAEQQAKSLTYALENYAVNGDATADANQFSGFFKLADSSMTVDCAGAQLTKKLTDKGWLKLHRNARNTAFWVFPTNVVAQIYEFLGTFAGPSEKMSDMFGATTLHLHDRPIFVSDFIQNEDTSGNASAGGTCVSGYLVGTGGQGLSAKLPPNASDVFQFQRLPAQAGKPHEYLRLMFGTCLALESKFWLVRIKAILNT